MQVKRSCYWNKHRHMEFPCSQAKLICLQLPWLSLTVRKPVLQRKLFLVQQRSEQWIWTTPVNVRLCWWFLGSFKVSEREKGWHAIIINALIQTKQEYKLWVSFEICLFLMFCFITYTISETVSNARILRTSQGPLVNASGVW